MTKKVLISLDELFAVARQYEQNNKYAGLYAASKRVKEWFAAQPDVGLMDINELIGHRERVLSKVEGYELRKKSSYETELASVLNGERGV